MGRELPVVQAFRSGIRRRLAFAFLLTATIPVLVAVYLAQSMLQQSSELFFVPELRQHLTRSLAVYGDYARTLEESMRSRTMVLSRDPALLRAAGNLEQGTVGSDALHPEARLLLEARLSQLRSQDSELQRLTLRLGTEKVSVGEDPSDSEAVHEFPVDTELLLDGQKIGLLHAEFVVERGAFDRAEELATFIEDYGKLQQDRGSVEFVFVLAFSVLLGLTIIAAVAAGSGSARGVTRRIRRLAVATREVTAGNLDARVLVDTDDELGQLAHGFNRMVQEVEGSRIRIDYLSRLASWQEVARRLAHEIKNPLTPIQLAVQELHQRLSGNAGAHQHLLDTSLEIVQTEVGTLRRLVTEFSEFARLPQSALESSDLRAFLRDLASEFERTPELLLPESGELREPMWTLSFDIDQAPLLVEFDAQMFRRVVINLISNAIQACWLSDRSPKVRVSVETTAESCLVTFDDNGPGVPFELRTQIFEPYVTNKADGTGLGLAIVKKIIIEHRGRIEVADSPSGGARLAVRLPLSRTALLPST